MCSSVFFPWDRNDNDIFVSVNLAHSHDRGPKFDQTCSAAFASCARVSEASPPRRPCQSPPRPSPPAPEHPHPAPPSTAAERRAPWAASPSKVRQQTSEREWRRQQMDAPCSRETMGQRRQEDRGSRRQRLANRRCARVTASRAAGERTPPVPAIRHSPARCAPLSLLHFAASPCTRLCRSALFAVAHSCFLVFCRPV